jgi:hypothetical protein
MPRSDALKNVWWLERDKVGIARQSDTDTEITYASPSEVKTIRLHIVKTDEDFVASGSGITLTESPAIPEEFHEALTYLVIAKGYEQTPAGMQQAIYFRNLWREEINECKRYANKGRDGSGYAIKPQSF